MPDNEVADWLLAPNRDLNMEKPLDLAADTVGRENIYKLLYFIDIGEADL